MTPSEGRILALWSGILGVDAAALDADGLVVVRDPRDVASTRNAIMRTARATWLLTADGNVADAQAFVADVEARERSNATFHYRDEPPNGAADPRVRVLDAADAPLLAALVERAGADAAEEADVDVAHPLAVGIVEDGRLLAIASLLGEDERTVDVGVLVDPSARRRGLGTAVVADLTRRATGRGLLVQYRRRRDNEGSARLAHACGFAPWAELVVAPR